MTTIKPQQNSFGPGILLLLLQSVCDRGVGVRKNVPQQYPSSEQEPNRPTRGTNIQRADRIHRQSACHTDSSTLISRPKRAHPARPGSVLSAMEPSCIN